MKRLTLLFFATAAMILFSACKPQKTEPEKLILGQWYNLCESSEITIVGQQNFKEGDLSLTFAADKVYIWDKRRGDEGSNHKYTLTQEGDNLILCIDDCLYDRSRVVELDEHRMVLEWLGDACDWDYHLEFVHPLPE